MFRGIALSPIMSLMFTLSQKECVFVLAGNLVFVLLFCVILCYFVLFCAILCYFVYFVFQEDFLTLLNLGTKFFEAVVENVGENGNVKVKFSGGLCHFIVFRFFFFGFIFFIFTHVKSLHKSLFSISILLTTFSKKVQLTDSFFLIFHEAFLLTDHLKEKLIFHFKTRFLFFTKNDFQLNRNPIFPKN